MSYNVYIEIDTGTGEFHTVHEVGNYTSNLSAMWWDALGHSLGDLSGNNCAEAEPLLTAAIAKMRAPENYDRYKALEPSNGWGNMQGAIAYVEEIRDACRRHPLARLRISH